MGLVVEEGSLSFQRGPRYKLLLICGLTFCSDAAEARHTEGQRALNPTLQHGTQCSSLEYPKFLDSEFASCWQILPTPLPMNYHERTLNPKLKALNHETQARTLARVASSEMPHAAITKGEEELKLSSALMIPRYMAPLLGCYCALTKACVAV